MTTEPHTDDLRSRLTDEQWAVTQEAATEPPFTGIYNDCKDPGTYRCVVCNEALFTSDDKYDSGSGWPSFTRPADDRELTTDVDHDLGYARTEVKCPNCDAHLGHVFPDGPGPSGQRFCINSAALNLDTDSIAD